MSSASTPAHEHSDELMSVGQQCTAPLCNLVDFLPFKCQHCSHPFCADHFLPDKHQCEKYDESKHNRVAPSCKSQMLSGDVYVTDSTRQARSAIPR